MKLLGVWYGDGSIMYGKNSTGVPSPKAVTIVAHHKNTSLIDFAMKTFADKIGAQPVKYEGKDGLIMITLNNEYVAAAFKHVFQSGLEGKTLPLFFNSLSKSLVTAFVAGLASTDGCLRSQMTCTMQMTNTEFMQQIYHLARSVGLPVSVTKAYIHGKATGYMQVPSTLLASRLMKVYYDNRLAQLYDLDEEEPCNKYKVIDGKIFLRINSKQVSKRTDDTVYTLGVEDDHSYSVEGLMAENCFLLTMKDDSIEGIYDTLKQCAMISKTAGGIGLNVHKIRASGSYIAGTNGYSNGIIPMLRVFNNTARYVDQGGNKRPGAFAIYLEPWHPDVFHFLDLRKNTGKEEGRARDLFYALWIPDLFMKRVEENGEWSLLCPHECPGLSDTWGEEFEKLYISYERSGKARQVISAQKLWFAILDSQVETGNPFMLYKDACNRKSNQQNLGTIKCSNLCTEIVEYSAPDEIAVCNLASLALPTFVNNDTFDFKKLHDVVKVVTGNLNKIIDINFYPVEEARRSNMRHRPIGIGVQGLADAFIKMRMPFESEAAALLNRQIFETMYYAALERSCELAEKYGHYETYPGCPVSKGVLQFDMWNVEPTDLWDWQVLREKIAKHGVRNSLLLAPMPTASTSQILGFNECFEPYTTNIYTRRVLAGEFQVVNPWLLKDLVDRGLWSESMKNRIIADGGSIQKSKFKREEN